MDTQQHLKFKRDDVETKNSQSDASIEQTTTTSDQCAIVGDDLTNAVSNPRQRKKGSTYPDWNVWQKRRAAKLCDAVALSKNINPSKLKKTKEKYPSRFKGYSSRLKTAISWLNSGLTIQSIPNSNNDPADCMILLPDFVKCAQATGMKVTPKMLELVGLIKKLPGSDIVPELEEPKKARGSIAQRNASLQEAANRTAAEQMKKFPNKMITRRLVVKLLHATPEWSELKVEVIERNIRKTWQ